MSSSATQAQIKHLFANLSKGASAQYFPPAGTLSSDLRDYIKGKAIGQHPISQQIATRFASSSVEIWQRSVHSFLISCALTTSSPLWASVAGYYSSHYVMRSFAHLLGYFQLHKEKKILQLQLSGNSYTCTIRPKGGNPEHTAYWKIVKSNPDFVSDPLFTSNEDPLPFFGPEKRSDQGHRNKANYADHIGGFPNFKVLDEPALKRRIVALSNLDLNDVPFPILDKYPDLNNVQLIAYHRMIKFKDYLDGIFGESNIFWKLTRRPSWFPEYLDFQVIEPRYTTIYAA